VAQSTCKAEYYFAANPTKEGLHLRQLIGEIFNAPITETTTIREDNQSATACSQNAWVNEKTKHIGMKWHFLKDHVEQGTIKLRYLPTNQMVADMFTKPLT
jgi:KUP system potassium uptake protein